MHGTFRRGSVIAVAALAAAVTLAPAAGAATGSGSTGSKATPAGSKAAAAKANPYSERTQAAAWLVTQLVGTDKDHYNFPGTTYADDGNTADGLLALDAAGVAHSVAARMLAWLENDAGNYAGTSPNFYPGSLAKLLLVAEAEHVDVHDFGGLDLVASLAGEENTDGLYQDPDTQYGYESTVTQALALVALSNTGDPADAPDQKAVTWLTDQQCQDGSFRNNETPHTVTTCSSDLDTTSFAIQALAAVNADPSAAVGWLTSQQNADGGFGAPSSNANSTAVAIQALIAAGQSPTAALRWLTDQQVGCDVSEPDAEAAVGAILFDDKPYEAGTALRATTQGLQALSQSPLDAIDASDATAKVPARLFCAVEASGGAGGPRGPKAHHGPKKQPKPTKVEAATLPRTGPGAIGPTTGVAFDCLIVGLLLVVAGRRRRA